MLVVVWPLLAPAAGEGNVPVPSGVSPQAWARISAAIQSKGLQRGEVEEQFSEQTDRFRALVAGIEGEAPGTPEMSGGWSLANLRDAAMRRFNYLRRWYVWTSGDVRDMKRRALRELGRGNFLLAETLLQSAADVDERAARDGGWRAEFRLRSAAATREQLGMLAEIQLEFDRAARDYLQAARGVPQEAEIELATYLNKGGRALVAGNHFLAAEAPLRRALSIRERLLPAGHPDIALTLVGLGAVYEGIGRLDEAAGYTERALKARETVVGTGNPQLIGNLTALARVRERQGRLDESEALLKRALAIAEQVFGPDGARTIGPLGQLGQFYQRSRRYPDAAIIFERLLNLDTRLFGQTDPETLQTQDILAVSRFFNGELAQAEALFVRSLQMREQTLGALHPAVMTNLLNLGRLYLSAGRHEAAEAAYARALSIAKVTSGPASPEYAQALAGLAKVNAQREAALKRSTRRTPARTQR